MGIDRAIDITGEQRKTILALLERHLPNSAAWVYGSRAKWTSRPQSDLDVVVFATPEQNRQVSDLREAFEESNLPFRVDLFVWDDVPEQFRKQIEADHVVLVEKEELGMAGDGWVSLRLGDVADIVMGQSPSGDTVSMDQGLALLNGPTEFGAHHPTPVQFTTDARKRAQPGDLLFCVRGSTTGRMNWADQEYAIGRGVAAIRHRDERALQPFVRGVIEDELPELLLQATGSTFPNVSAHQLAEIPYPNLARSEQRAIAHVLGTLDDKIELNRRMNETLEEMARTLFKSWFVDFLPVRAKMAAKQNNPSLLLPEAESGTWFVYAIGCADGSLYIGQTENLRQRWLQHSSSKGGRWTKSHPPQRVAYWEKQPSRQAAGEREKWLKTGFGRKWLKKEIATRTQTGDPVRAKMEGRDTGLPKPLADLFPDRLVDSELGPIPEGWEVGPLGELCHKPQYGYTASAKDENVGPKFLRITDINKEAWIDWDAVPYCEITEEDLDKYRLYNGDVLIARMADPGHGVMVEENQEVVFASYLIRFRPIHERHARLIQYWLRSDRYWELVSGRGAGTTRVSLNARVLSEFPLVVPSDPIVEAFCTQVTNLRARVVANAEESRTLTAQRDIMLPKLVSGELRLEGAEKYIENVL